MPSLDMAPPAPADIPSAPDDPTIDYEEIAKRLRTGEIVPFFGAGASACYGQPSGEALARDLVAEGKFPDIQGSDDLSLVASYLVQKVDDIALHRVLRTSISASRPPGKLHEVLAKSKQTTLYVTTNYDYLLEDALKTRDPWIVVDRGTPPVVFCRKGAAPWIQTRVESLREVIPEITDSANPVILKLHGSLAPKRDEEAFLITEEQYVDFLGRPADTQIPSMLFAHMRSRSFLFLGYALKDWNVRVLLRKLENARAPNQRIASWGIVKGIGKAEKEVWERKGVQLHDFDVDRFARKLEEVL